MKRILLGLLILLLGLSLFATTALANGAGTYAIRKWTVDGGGEHQQQAGGYTLNGTAGQPDSGTDSTAGYTLNGGYWGAGSDPGGPSALGVTAVQGTGMWYGLGLFLVGGILVGLLQRRKPVV